MARCTVQRGRFLGFAGGHFVVSAVSVPLWLLAADPAAEQLGLWALGAGLMLLYLPAGALTAGLFGWERPTPGRWGRSVLLGALAGWAGGFGGWAGLCLGIELEWTGRAYGCFCLLLSPAFLASPSFVLMLGVLGAVGGVPGAWDPLWWGGIALAGLLPALLFHLGAWAGAALGERRRAGRPEGGGALHVL